MSLIWRSITDLFFPPVCPCCGRAIDEVGQLVCDDCISTFDTTRHVFEHDNRVMQLFADIKKVKAGAAFAYYYRHSALRKAILSLKYRGMPELGLWLGEMAQNEQWFADIDVIVPVPLHPNRQRQRGYNQAEEIARGIAKVISRPVANRALRRVVNNSSQTSMSAEQRRQNTVGVFALHDDTMLKGKTLLLVDDIVTTGSTLRDCIRCLTPLRGTTIKVLTIGVPMKEGQIDESILTDEDIENELNRQQFAEINNFV